MACRRPDAIQSAMAAIAPRRSQDAHGNVRARRQARQDQCRSRRESADPRRHRRLDLRALAQQLLSPRLPHAQELDYASRQLTAIEVNGTYYSTMKPASFQEVARRDARRLHVLAEGLALRDQSQAARDGRRIDRALRRQRHRRAGRQARADRLAVHADQGLRCRRTSRPSWRCCRRRRAAARCAT